MSKKAVEHHRSADGEGSNEPANTMPLGNRNGLHTHSRGNVGDGKAINTPGTEWPHLDPVIRPIAAQDNLARAHHILKDLYVSHPPAQYVERQIEQLIRLPRRIRMPGVFLCGDSGMGKTHLLRRIERRHRRLGPDSAMVVLPGLLHSSPGSRRSGRPRHSTPRRMGMPVERPGRYS